MLFVDRARQVDPAFELTEVNARAVAESAAASKAFRWRSSWPRLARGSSPRPLLRRLGQRLKTLTDGAADAPARQRTLRDTIAWSYDLLDAPDRALLARVGVFAGGFELPAAGAVVTV